MQRCKNSDSITPEQREHYKELTQKLTDAITKAFNEDFSKGELINSKWLKNVIESFYQRPKGVDDHTKYFVPFITRYAEESENRLNRKTGKKISPR